MDQGNGALNVSSGTVNPKRSYKLSPNTSCLNSVGVESFILTVSLIVDQISGSMESPNHRSVQEELQAQGNDDTLNTSGIYGTKNMT